MEKITLKVATKIARSVIKYLNSGVDPRTVDLNEQINGWLREVNLGWKLKEGTYIDGVSCQRVCVLAKDIKKNAVEKYTTEITISDNIEVFEWHRGDWIIFASTEHEDGRYFGFTKGFGSKANTLKIARQWAKLTAAQLRIISQSI